jgi:hypothetical protein
LRLPFGLINQRIRLNADDASGPKNRPAPLISLRIFSNCGFKRPCYIKGLRAYSQPSPAELGASVLNVLVIPPQSRPPSQADRHRALELLAASRGGLTEAVLRATAISTKMIVELVRE